MGSTTFEEIWSWTGAMLIRTKSVSHGAVSRLKHTFDHEGSSAYRPLVAVLTLLVSSLLTECGLAVESHT